MKERRRVGRLIIFATAAVAAIGLVGCSDDDTADQSVELQDDVLLSVHDNCVEIDGPSVKGSSCGDPLIVSVLAVGQGDARWVYGLAPEETERIIFGDEVEDRFVELGGLQAFAIPYQANAELVAEDADGEIIHEFRVPIS
jgi:hypothetical protein